MHHHARLLVGPHDECFAKVPHEYRVGVDAEVFIEDQLSVEAARALRTKAERRPLESDKRRFVISCTTFTREAQNALLKLFEDPPETAAFYIIAPRISALLPTLRSRLDTILVPGNEADVVSEPTVAFLSASYGERLQQVATLQKAKDTQAIRSLITGIERALAQRITDKVTNAENGLADMVLVATYADVKGGSPKMLLEHLALSIPEKQS